MATAFVGATELRPDDVIEYRDTPVTIIAGPDSTKDRFGQPMVRYFARRHDTGAEGFVIFGPAATVHLTNRPSQGVID